MDWNKESILTLINLYKSKEVLWNPKNLNYKNRNIRYTALSEIACSFSTTPLEIERKIKNVSCHYFREKKKIDDSKTAIDQEDTYRSKWFAYNYLNFLGNRNESKGKKKVKKVVNDKRTNSPNLYSETQVLHNAVDEASSDSLIEFPDTLSDTLKEFCKKHEAAEFIPEFIQVMKNFHQKHGRDEDSLFGDYIAGQLRQMDKSLKAVVRNRINTIIYEAESGCVMPNTINADFFQTLDQRNSALSNSVLTQDLPGRPMKNEYLGEYSIKNEPHGSF